MSNWLCWLRIHWEEDATMIEPKPEMIDWVLNHGSVARGWWYAVSRCSRCGLWTAMATDGDTRFWVRIRE